MTHGKWHGGKGSFRRPTSVNETEENLRWELIKSTTTPERKEEIKRELEKLRNGGDNE